MKTPVQGFHTSNNIYQATTQTPWLPFLDVPVPLERAGNHGVIKTP